MEYKIFDKLTDDAKIIREKVFMQEQGFENEFDDIDERSIHVVVYDNAKPIGTGRMYAGDGDGQMIIGRIAVLPEYRNHHLGKGIMEALENKAIADQKSELLLSAQCVARGFYERLGYKTIGEVYLDEHCEHIDMVKKI